MKTIGRSLFICLIAAAMLLSFAACSGGGNKQNPNPDSKASNAPASNIPVKTPAATLRPGVSAVTYTIDATAAYASGKVSAGVMSSLGNNGMLLNKGLVTMQQSQPLSAPFRLFKAQGVDIVVENGAIKSIQGLENGACGEGSRWIVKINGQQNDSNVDTVSISSGDTIEIVYIFN